MNISTTVNQQHYDRQMSVLRGKVQRRAINLGASIARDTGTQQNFTHLSVTIQCSKV